jgi:hypothetical protein
MALLRVPRYGCVPHVIFPHFTLRLLAVSTLVSRLLLAVRRRVSFSLSIAKTQLWRRSVTSFHCCDTPRYFAETSA